MTTTPSAPGEGVTMTITDEVLLDAVRRMQAETDGYIWPENPDEYFCHGMVRHYRPLFEDAAYRMQFLNAALAAAAPRPAEAAETLDKALAEISAELGSVQLYQDTFPGSRRVISRARFYPARSSRQSYQAEGDTLLSALRAAMAQAEDDKG